MGRRAGKGDGTNQVACAVAQFRWSLIVSVPNNRCATTSRQSRCPQADANRRHLMIRLPVCLRQAGTRPVFDADLSPRSWSFNCRKPAAPRRAHLLSTTTAGQLLYALTEAEAQRQPHRQAYERSTAATAAGGRTDAKDQVVAVLRPNACFYGLWATPGLPVRNQVCRPGH